MIQIGSVCSDYSDAAPFKVYQFGYVRSSFPILMHVGLIATPEVI